VSPSRKRIAAETLREEFSVSERRACEVVDQPRSSQRYEAKVRDDEPRLVTRILELVRRYPRYGYRFITAKLRQENWGVNAKRVYRLWRREGLKVPRKKRKKRRLGSSVNGCHRRKSECKNDVWAWDFVFDHTTNGSQLKWLSIIDEFTRECLCLKVGRSITSEDVIDTLSELFAMRGVPQHIRSDNGPEFIAKNIQRWLQQLNIEALYVEPGSPWENGYAESFHSRVRDEFLALEEFENLPMARRLTTAWKTEYNEQRPHSSLGYAIRAIALKRCGLRVA
jgi:putative transposase